VGRCWELRFRGDLQWHAGVDPFTVETLSFGRKAGVVIIKAVPHVIHEQGLNLLGGII